MKRTKTQINKIAKYKEEVDFLKKIWWTEKDISNCEDNEFSDEEIETKLKDIIAGINHFFNEYDKRYSLEESYSDERISKLISFFGVFGDDCSDSIKISLKLGNIKKLKRDLAKCKKNLTVEAYEVEDYLYTTFYSHNQLRSKVLPNAIKYLEDGYDKRVSTIDGINRKLNNISRNLKNEKNK